MAKRRIGIRRVSRERRAKILAVADQKGLTAIEVEKKFGVSRWTFYSWRKRKGGAAGRPASRGSMGGPCTCNCAEELRAMLPGLMRQELTAAMRDLLLGATVQRRGRRRRK